MADFTPNRPRAYSNPNKRAIRQLLAAEACEPMARRMAAEHPDRFKFHPTTWGKFPDGTDKIIIGGYTPTNELAGEHVVLLCSFHNNDVTWSQFQVMIVLLQSFIESFNVVQRIASTPQTVLPKRVDAMTSRPRPPCAIYSEAASAS